LPAGQVSVKVAPWVVVTVYVKVVDYISWSEDIMMMMRKRRLLTAVAVNVHWAVSVALRSATSGILTPSSTEIDPPTMYASVNVKAYAFDTAYVK
jgi:hypothetical protein